MIVIGIDIGSVATKAYMISNSNHYRAMMPTGWSPREAGQAVIDQLLDASD
jgi:activator of 2-hydroxyglutaryl-CoA dehydratase